MMDQLKFTLDATMNTALAEERVKYETIIKDLEKQNQVNVCELYGMLVFFNALFDDDNGP